MTFSNAARSTERTKPAVAMPALAMTMSIPPKCSTTPFVARLERVPAGDVGFPGAGVRADPVGDLLLLFGFEADEGDLRAARSEAFGQPGADAAGGAGDQHDLAVDLLGAAQQRKRVGHGALLDVARRFWRAPYRTLLRVSYPISRF